MIDKNIDVKLAFCKQEGVAPTGTPFFNKRAIEGVTGENVRSAFPPTDAHYQEKLAFVKKPTTGSDIKSTPQAPYVKLG